MRRILLLTLLVWGAFASVAQAQITVQLQADKETFLLYEAILITVNLRNISGRPIQLEGVKEKVWLKFTVNEQNGGPVEALGRMNADQSVLIPAGETVSRRVNILPLCDLRSHGSYRVQAQVTVGGIQSISEPLKFTVLEGRSLWKETVGLPSLDSGKDEYRTYSLLAQRGQSDDSLYVRVEDDPPQRVYGVIPLGDFLSVIQPKAQVDQDAHVHVLFQNGPHSFGYAQINPRATVLRRAVFADYNSRPVLVKQDGIVRVQGGEQVYPKQEHVMTEAELNPPPPPPTPPKKKKSWWSFGDKSDQKKNLLADEMPETPR